MVQIVVLVLLLVVYLLFYEQIIKPLLALQFYKKQAIQCEFVPMSGSNPQDSKNVINHGDYYYDWLRKSKGSPVFCKNVGSVCALIVTEPKLVQELFINKDDFIKHPFQNALVKTLSPYGLVLLEGNKWKKHRKLITKGFTYGKIDELLATVRRSSVLLVDQLIKENKIQNVFNFFKQTAGNIISMTYFQEDINQIVIQGKTMPIFLSDLISELTNESYGWKYCIFGMPLIKLGLFKHHRQLLRKIKLMREAVRKILYKHKSMTRTEFSMWDVFLNEDADMAMSDDEIIDEFITFFSDGVYTTGHFMTMMTYHLSKNTQWLQKLRKQLQENLANVEKPNQNLINNLPILTACTKETLRLAPPVVTGIERIAVKDCDLGGIKIKKDTMLMACHLVNHLSEDFHDEPLRYDPNRWLDEQSKTLQKFKEYPGTYIPFSIGDRQCPGQKFAMAQAALFFSQFLVRMDYQLEGPYELKFTQRFLRQPLNSFNYIVNVR